MCLRISVYAFICIYICLHMHVFLCVHIYVFSCFSQSEAGLNKEFSFSKTGCLQLRSPINYLSIAGERKKWIPTFPKGISAKWNANHLDQDLNSGYWLHFLWQQALHKRHFSCMHLWMHFSIFMCLVCVYIYLPLPPHEQDVTVGEFQVEFNRFEFRVFLLLDRLPY